MNFYDQTFLSCTELLYMNQVSDFVILRLGLSLIRAQYVEEMSLVVDIGHTVHYLYNPSYVLRRALRFFTNN